MAPMAVNELCGRRIAVGARDVREQLCVDVARSIGGAL